MGQAGQAPGTAIMSTDAFCEFYRSALPDVYGFLLRLCAGNRAQAEDLTQDVWLALVEELRHGRIERADVRWLISRSCSRSTVPCWCCDTWMTSLSPKSPRSSAAT